MSFHSFQGLQRPLLGKNLTPPNKWIPFYREVWRTALYKKFRRRLTYPTSNNTVLEACLLPLARKEKYSGVFSVSDSQVFSFFPLATGPPSSPFALTH